MLTRREVLQTAALTSAAVAAGRPALGLTQTTPAAGAGKDADGPFTLPPLPYAYDALEPYIDAQTMMLHHDKHHAAYVQNLNKAVATDPSLAGKLGGKSVEDLIRNMSAVPEAIRPIVRNHGGGHSNHSLFWQVMSKNSGRPQEELAKAIEKSFGSQSGFQEKFNASAAKVFGSGWAWLSLTPGKELLIETTANQDSPYMTGNLPLLGIDVWEHAYYLKYQNRRAEYISAFVNVINWDFISGRYSKGVAT